MKQRGCPAVKTVNVVFPSSRSVSYPESGETSGRDDSNSFGRRTCLRGIGGLASTAGAAGLFSEDASAATTRRGIEFDRVVNVVNDLGLDRNGNRPIQSELNNAEQEGTLFVFPEGEYRVTGRILMLFRDSVGMVGRGNVRFKVPNRYNDWAVIMDHGQDVLFENIDIDLRSYGATPGCRFAGYNDVQVHNVEFIGQGAHPNKGAGVNPALGLIARDRNARVLAENVVARNKGRMGAYNRGNGRLGVWVGKPNKGTVTLRNCHFSGFPNNGLYASRTPGVVQVEGGVYRNNDVSQVRLGSEGSYVKDARIEVDPSKSRSPNPQRMLNARGVRIESGPINTAGVTVENCDIRIANGASSQGGVVAARPAGMFDVVDTRIRVDADNTHAILGMTPNGGGAFDTPPWPHRARIANVSVTGNASGGHAIEMKSRPESVIRSCCIEQHGSDRGGIMLSNSNRSVVRGSTVNVTNQVVETAGTRAKVWGNSTGGSCPGLGSSGASTSGTRGGSGSNGGSDGSGSNGGSDGSNSGGSGGRKRIEFSGSRGSRIRYRMKVSGEIDGTQDSEGEVESRKRAVGRAGQWGDAFTFTGRIEKLVVKGDVSMKYKRSDDGPNLLRFNHNKSGDTVDYSAHVGDSFWRNGTTERGDGFESANWGSRIGGSLGNGNWSWKDEFRCNGVFRSAVVDDVFEVTVSND